MSEAHMKKIEDDLMTAELSRASQLSVENKVLRDERDRLRAALEVAGDAICSEFCGSGPCHKKCLAVKAALTPAGGG